MRINTFLSTVLFLLIIACTPGPTGTLKGTVSPSEPRAQITISQNVKPVVSVNSAPVDGTFSVHLKAGVYTIMITSATSTIPVTITNVTIKTGETTLLPPVNLAVQAGNAVVTGRITPAAPGTKVKLILEGKERAAAQVGVDGRYEFSELPAGNYAIQAEAPGYAGDTTPLVVSPDRKTEQNVLLLPITTTTGVDWTSGMIRATGHGVPPVQSSNSTVRHEMAKRAALSDAQRNLLKIIENIRIGSHLDIKTYMRDKVHAERIQGFIRGYSVASEMEHDDGSIDIVLELPLTGPSGLSRYITE